MTGGLRTKDIQKLSRILDIATEKVTEMLALNLIDTGRAQEILIRFDWKNLKRRFSTSTKAAREMIVSDYGASSNRVRKSILGQNEKRIRVDLMCSTCGRPITCYEKNRYERRCKECAMKAALNED